VVAGSGGASERHAGELLGERDRDPPPNGGSAFEVQNFQSRFLEVSLLRRQSRGTQCRTLCLPYLQLGCRGLEPELSQLILQRDNLKFASSGSRLMTLCAMW
jgi:hypothetical protein